jgi:hypothetical protein
MYPTDGTVASKGHDQASPLSDHRPDYRGNVRAIDFGGPAEYVDSTIEAIRLSKDLRVKYVIHDRRMFSSYPTPGYPPFTWRPYSGASPHATHAHLSVLTATGEQTQPWSIAPAPPQEEEEMAFLPLKKGDGLGDREFKKSDVAAIQAMINRAYTAEMGQDGTAPLVTDGIYGQKTVEAIRTYLGGDGESFYGNLYDDLHAKLATKAAQDVFASMPDSLQSGDTVKLVAE